MKYYNNIFTQIKSALFGGNSLVVVRERKDYEAEALIPLLERTAAVHRKFGEALKIDWFMNEAIRAEKAADYIKQMLDANGFYTGIPDFEKMHELAETVKQDWWLKDYNV